MDETVVTLRPKDPTAALRQKRARERRRNEKPSEINADVTVAEPSRQPSRPVHVAHASHPDVALPGVSWSVYPLAGTTVGLMAVSLTHLSDGVTQLTAIPEWQSWAMAVGIDCMLISVALAQLTAPPDVKRDIAVVAGSMEIGTLAMSAGLNALAFTGGHFDLAHVPQVLFGCFVPAAISGATYILARMTRRA
jgi:hypothetical protein